MSLVPVLTVQGARLIRFLLIAAHNSSCQFHRQQGSRACDTAAGTGHALQKVAVVFSCLCHSHELAAIPKTLSTGGLDLQIRILLLGKIRNLSQLIQ